MFCSKCGIEVAEGNKFCSCCGASIVDAGNQAAGEQQNAVRPLTHEQKVGAKLAALNQASPTVPPPAATPVPSHYARTAGVPPATPYAQSASYSTFPSPHHPPPAQPAKGSVPAWAVVLITIAIMLVLGFCCLLTIGFMDSLANPSPIYW